jgi:hypothetical protein
MSIRTVSSPTHEECETMENQVVGGEGFTHIVLTRYFTRFSSSTKDVNELLAPDRGWLDDRLQKFQTYCFPSVIAQSVQDFIWLIYFDVNTPVDYLEKVKAVVGSRNNIRIVMCHSFDATSRKKSILEAMQLRTKWLLTTRLDTDDGWNRDFVKVLQSNLRFDRRHFLNFPVGVLLYNDKTFLYRHRSNAFISLLEPTDEFLTVYSEQHVHAERIAPITQLPEFPAFLQTVHGNNRSNRPRGVRVPRLLARVGFESIFGPAARVCEENEWSIVAYNIGGPAMWALRDHAAAAVRGALSSFTGNKASPKSRVFID